MKAKDVLVVLDDADLRSRLDQAHAAQASAKAKVEQARLDYNRSQRLRALQSISQEELDQANTNLRTAAAEMDRARERGQGGQDRRRLRHRPGADRWAGGR